MELPAAQTGLYEPEGELFIMFGWTWDVAAATRLVTHYPVRQADIRALAWARAVIRIDAGHAATVDLTRPLLAVPIPDADTPLVIDGWHRIHRALIAGLIELPVILLDEVDERACRIRGGDITPS